MPNGIAVSAECRKPRCSADAAAREIASHRCYFAKHIALDVASRPCRAADVALRNAPWWKGIRASPCISGAVQDPRLPIYVEVAGLVCRRVAFVDSHLSGR